MTTTGKFSTSRGGLPSPFANICTTGKRLALCCGCVTQTDPVQCFMRVPFLFVKFFCFRCDQTVRNLYEIRVRKKAVKSSARDYSFLQILYMLSRGQKVTRHVLQIFYCIFYARLQKVHLTATSGYGKITPRKSGHYEITKYECHSVSCPTMIDRYCPLPSGSGTIRVGVIDCGSVAVTFRDFAIA